MFPLDDSGPLNKSKTPEKFGIINQHGTSRKVRLIQAVLQPCWSDPPPRKHIFDAVKCSLDRLQVDYIDVLHCERQT